VTNEGAVFTLPERGRGPTGTAIRTGKVSMCRNMLTDPHFAPWREQAIKRGYASSIVLPLMADGKAFGAINIYSREPDPFTEDEVKFLNWRVTFLRNISDEVAVACTGGAGAAQKEALSFVS
jgi:putative methionine-R-sulfoxide reductase with GAF domain